jgi:hypothetical protein
MTAFFAFGGVLRRNDSALLKMMPLDTMRCVMCDHEDTTGIDAH